jgi:endonuclease-3
MRRSDAQGASAEPRGPARILEIAERLDASYGPRRWHRHGGPLDQLIATVLSQHTSDTNTARSFASLKATFPDWEAVRTAETAAVADAIRSGGLARIKAPRLQAILGSILGERGRLDLEHLRAMPLDAARAWLLALPGVGPKTAACVPLFSLGLPALPVDTHVHRVARRLGLIGPEVDAERAHLILEADLGGDRDRVYAFHLNAIAHGRAVCSARRPACDRCPLTDCCDYFAGRVA